MNHSATYWHDGAPVAVPAMDALGRRLPTDWLRACAQAKEARLVTQGVLPRPLS